MAVALEADVSALPEDSQTSLAVEGALNKYALTLFKGIRVHREMSLNTDMERYHSELIKGERKATVRSDKLLTNRFSI